MQDIPRAQDEDYFYFAHYDNSIRESFSIKENARWNYHTFILDFIQRCDPDFPFRVAVLAWTARHYYEETNLNDTSWIKYYEHASSQVTQLMKDQSPDEIQSSNGNRPVICTRMEIIICSSLFLCRCDALANNYPSLCNRLRELANWFSIQPFEIHLSSFACRVLCWMSYMSVRVSIFNPDDNGGLTLLDSLSRRLDHDRIVQCSKLWLAEIFGSSYPSSDFIQDAEMEPVTTLTHEIFCLISSMLQYGHWRRIQGVGSTNRDLSSAKITAIEANIRRMNAEFGLATATNTSARILRLDYDSKSSIDTMDSIRKFNRPVLKWLTCYCGFMVSQILWSRILDPNIRTDSQATTAVNSILKIALQLRRSKYCKVLKTILWPLPLFVAGIETTDELYVDWILSFIEEVSTSRRSERSCLSSEQRESRVIGGGQSGGAGGNKVKELIIEVRTRQHKEGRRVSVTQVIRDMNDDLGAFIF